MQYGMRMCVGFARPNPIEATLPTNAYDELFLILLKIRAAPAVNLCYGEAVAAGHGHYTQNVNPPYMSDSKMNHIRTHKLLFEMGAI